MSTASTLAALHAHEQLSFDAVKMRVAALATTTTQTEGGQDRSAGPRSTSVQTNRFRLPVEPLGDVAPETEDLCVTCGREAKRYSAFRVGKVWRLVCKDCLDTNWRPLGPVPCSGCNVPARLVTIRDGRVLCPTCKAVTP